MTVTYHFESKKDKDNKSTVTKEEALTRRPRKEILSLKSVTYPHDPRLKVWQIVPPDAEPVSMGADGLPHFLALMAFKLAQRPVSPRASATESLMRLKELGIAAREFDQDYDEHLVFAPEYMQEALTPYIKDAQFFFVAGSYEPYSFNANLSEHSIPDIYPGEEDPIWVAPEPPVKNLPVPEPPAKNMDKVIMFYEGRDEKLIFRYGGKAAICFADGHTALVTPDEARTLIWNPSG